MKKTMFDLLKKYEVYVLVRKGLSKYTWTSYRTYLNRFLKNYDADKNLRSNILKFCSNFQNNNSYNRVASSINNFFAFCYTETEMNDFKFRLEHRKTHNKPYAKSQNEVMEIIENLRLKAQKSNLAIDARNYALVMLAYSSGMRKSELLQFNYNQLNKDGSYICKGKGEKERLVLIAPAAIKALDDYLKVRPPMRSTKYFWHSGYNTIQTKKPNLTQNTIGGVFKNATGHSPHFFRHCFASHLIQNGANLFVVQELMGHASVDTTQVYLKNEPQHLKKMMKAHSKLDKIRLPKKPSISEIKIMGRKSKRDFIKSIKQEILDMRERQDLSVTQISFNICVNHKVVLSTPFIEKCLKMWQGEKYKSKSQNQDRKKKQGANRYILNRY